MMTDEQLLAWAKQAGAQEKGVGQGGAYRELVLSSWLDADNPGLHLKQFHQFAELVASAQMEKRDQLLIAQQRAHHQEVQEQVAAAITAERERICLALPGCDSVDPQWVADMVRNGAAANNAPTYVPLRAHGVLDADDNLDCWDTPPFELATSHVAALNAKDPAAMWRVAQLYVLEAKRVVDPQLVADMLRN